MYNLTLTPEFIEKVEKRTEKDHLFNKKVKKALLLLAQDPFYPSLRTHKANVKAYGIRWSSWIEGDWRMIWDYNGKNIIVLLTVGTHSGRTKVYQ